MKLPEDYEYDYQREGRLPIKNIILAMFLLTLIGGAIAYLANMGESPKTNPKSDETAAEEEVVLQQNTQQEMADPVYNADGKAKDVERLYKDNKLTAQDLDFWDMYPDVKREFVDTEEMEKLLKEKEEDGLTTREKYEIKEAQENGQVQGVETQEAQDGKHTLLIASDGTEEWVQMNPYLEKNTYDFTKFVKKGDRLSYMEDGKNKSFLGADISKYNENVNFQSLKKDGIDFVMLRVGARAYGSGEIKADDKFVENITAASEAGVHIGLYFFSQAVTKEEAVEEANYVLQSIGEHKITYPIAFDMEYITNDTARIDTLTKEDKTAVAKAFLDTIKKAGYKAMIYGNKEWLVREIDLTRLTEYDIWLSQQKDIPDYPYQFQMWQYTTEGKVNGVSTDIDLNVSFIDYSEK